MKKTITSTLLILSLSLSTYAQSLSYNFFASNSSEASSVLKVKSINSFYDLKESQRVYQNINDALVADRIQSNKMTKIGKVLTFVGAPLVVIGGIMVANADEYYYECVNGVCEGDPVGGFGVIVLAGGIGLTGTGIVLWTIGANR